MPNIIKCRPCGRPPCGEVEVKHEPSDGEATAVPVPRPSGDDDAPTVKQLKPRPSAQHGTASRKRKAGKDGPEAQRSSISSQPIRPWTGGRTQQGLASTSPTGSSSYSSKAPRLENTTDPTGIGCIMPSGPILCQPLKFTNMLRQHWFLEPLA